jgi:hypothetical protein
MKPVIGLGDVGGKGGVRMAANVAQGILMCLCEVGVSFSLQRPAGKRCAFNHLEVCQS